MCLIAINGLKVIEVSSSLQENEIDMVDSPFNEDYKSIFFSREALMWGTAGKLSENG